jgi:excisionase family DNA binding protein
MQAYATAESFPPKPEFAGPLASRQALQDGPTASRATTALANVSSTPGTSPTIAALVVEAMDETVLAALARRLTPHLEQQFQPVAGSGDAVYTVASLAAELGVSPKTIRGAISRGELRAVKRGARWIIPVDAVLDWGSRPEARLAKSHRCRPRVPQTAGPSLRAVFCGSTSGARTAR